MTYHIITWENRWSVCKAGKFRAYRKTLRKNDAIKIAKKIKNVKKIIVHNHYGEVDKVILVKQS